MTSPGKKDRVKLKIKIQNKKAPARGLLTQNHRNGAESLLTNFFHGYRIQRVLIALCDRDKYMNLLCVGKGGQITRQQNKKLFIPV